MLSKPYKISKNSTIGTQWFDFDDFGGRFGHPFFIKFRNHPNLLYCNEHYIKTVHLPFQASHFGIENPLKNHRFSRRDLGPHFFKFYSLLCQKARFWDPLQNPVGVKMATTPFTQWCPKPLNKHPRRLLFSDLETDSLPKGRPKRQWIHFA